MCCLGSLLETEGSKADLVICTLEPYHCDFGVICQVFGEDLGKAKENVASS